MPCNPDGIDSVLLRRWQIVVGTISRRLRKSSQQKKARLNPTRCLSSPAQILAPELLHSIFSKPMLDQQTIASCTLVCRSWEPQASKVLFESIYITGWIPGVRTGFLSKQLPNIPKLERTIKRGSRLSTTMIDLTISDMQVDFARLGSVLGRLPNLQDFHLVCITFKPISSTYTVDVSATMAEIRTLCLRGRQMRMRMPKHQSVLDALLFFHKVDHLSFTADEAQTNAEDSRLLRTHPHGSIQVRELTTTSGFVPGCVNYFGVKKLNLVVSIIANGESLNSLIAKYGPTVEELKLVFVAHEGRSPEPDASNARPLSLVSCGPALRALHLDFNFRQLNTTFQSTWNTYLAEFAHIHVEELSINLQLYQLRLSPQESLEVLVQNLLDFVDWRALDEIASHCEELIRISLDLRIHLDTMHSVDPSNRQVLNLQSLPASVTTRLSTRTLVKLRCNVNATETNDIGDPILGLTILGQ